MKGYKSIGRGKFTDVDNFNSEIVYVGAYKQSDSEQQTTDEPVTETTIGKSAFAFSNVEKVVIGDGTVSIGARAFYHCKKLKQIMFGEGLQFIDEEAFALCEELTVIYLPKSLQKIGESAFFGCKKLEKIVFYEGLYSIGQKAFAECEKLEKITLPTSLKYLGNYAFAHCYELKLVDFLNSVLQIHIKTDPIEPENIDIHSSDSESFLMDENSTDTILQIGKLAFLESQKVIFKNLTIIKKNGKKVHITQNWLKNVLVYGWSDFITVKLFN